MQIRPVNQYDEPALIQLIACFRVALAGLRGQEKQPDLAAAEQELMDYRDKNYPIFIAEVSGSLVGYLVCRVDGDVIWAESLYVEPANRRCGIASLLYAEAEQLAEQLGGDAPYNWVDPTNSAIVGLLAKRGYNVLNLLELRRPYPGEQLSHTIRVGSHEFNCS